jgi:adenylyl- and sulfurtransferase ThiI
MQTAKNMTEISPCNKSLISNPLIEMDYCLSWNKTAMS